MFSKIRSRKTTIGFFLVGLFAAALTTPLWAQNTPPIEPPADSSTQTPTVSATQSPLDKSVADFQKAWLNVDGQTQLAFYLKETSGKAHGGVLLLPDLNQHPAGHGLINNLRHSLANNHWHTLALNIAGANQQQTIKTIDAGIAYLNTQGIYNIALLGDGAGAAQALHYASSLPPIDPTKSKFNKIRAVLLINANNHLPGSDDDILESFSEIKLPIFDVYSSSDYRQKQRAKARAQTAQREIKTPYQQARLPQISDFRQNSENRVTKRIRGWLDKNVAGFMVAK
jgi:hypothetical protein